MLNMIEPTYDGGELQLHEEVLHRCKTVYPNGNQLLYQRISTCLAFATQFLIPLLIVCLCYTVIGVKISKRACIGETTAEQARSQLKSKRKTIKLLILVVMCFALSWLPFNLLHIFKDFKDVQFTLTEHYLAHWFAMCSCVWNPFIYFGLNRRYREGILSVLTCCLPNHIRLAPSSDLTEQNRSTSLLQGTGRKCHHHKHRPKGSRRNNGKCKPTNDHSNGSKMSNVSSLKPLENVNKSNDLEDDNADEVMETTNEQMQSMSIEVYDSKVNRASATELTVRPLGKVQVEVQSDKSNGCPVRRKSSMQ